MKSPGNFSPDTIQPVHIEIPLCLETNKLNDCGVLSLQMVLSKDTQIPKNELSVEKLRERVNKTFEEGVDSGRICKILKEEGYEVKYFSTINIESMANNNPETDFEKWDPRVIGAVGALQNSTLEVNLAKLHNSAQWLTKPENKNIIASRNLSIKEIADFLRENKRVILSVMSGAHYVVIVGVDNQNIYFNDPAAGKEPTQRSMPHADFLKYWAERPDMRDAVVASMPT